MEFFPEPELRRFLMGVVIGEAVGVAPGVAPGVAETDVAELCGVEGGEAEEESSVLI
jgi:hypothetical protein